MKETNSVSDILNELSQQNSSKDFFKQEQEQEVKQFQEAMNKFSKVFQVSSRSSEMSAANVIFTH